jgi:hypothetical protein
VLPASTPGAFRIAFERQAGSHFEYQQLYKQLREHLRAGGEA